MAQTEHLPIYKATYDLCLYLEQIVQHFSRYHKYALGADLREGARRALKLVVRANARRDKTPVLLQLREELEELGVAWTRWPAGQRNASAAQRDYPRCASCSAMSFRPSSVIQ